VQTEERRVNWEQIKRCLALIDKTSKDFLRQALLIGGAACWFYRHQLFKANDPDFKLRSTASQEENRWLSRDIDFTGVFSQDALLILPHFVREHEGKRFIEVDGVRFGFAQVGVTFDPVEAMQSARVAHVIVDDRRIEFLVADPLTLYYEKDKLCVKRGNPNDHLHKELLHDYIAFELTSGAERLVSHPDLPMAESKLILQRWLAVKNKTPEIFKDGRLRKRLEPLLQTKPSHPISIYLTESDG
jgi:hypothetical protein